MRRTSSIQVWSLRWYEGDMFSELAAEAGMTMDRIIDHPKVGHSFVLRRSPPTETD